MVAPFDANACEALTVRLGLLPSQLAPAYQPEDLSNFKEVGEVLDDLFRHFLLDVVATLDGLVRHDI